MMRSTILKKIIYKKPILKKTFLKKATSKKFYYVCLLLLVALIVSLFLGLQKSFSSKLSAHTIKTSPILTTGPFPQSLALLYGDDPFHPYTAYAIGSPDAPLTLLSESFSAFTEGFLPTPLMTKLMAFVHSHDNTHSKMFHDYYHFNDTHYLAFSGNIHQLVAINLDQQTLNVPTATPTQDLGKMYVSSMQHIDNQLVVVGAEANSYHLLVYSIDLSSFQVTSSLRLPAPEKVQNGEHFFVSSEGILYVLDEGNGVSCINVFTGDTTVWQTTFETQSLLPYKESFLVWGIQKNKLLVASPHLEHTLTFDLPTGTSKVMRAFYSDDLLTLLCFDGVGQQFSHYISSYHLPTSTWSYLLGIESSPTDFPIDLISYEDT